MSIDRTDEDLPTVANEPSLEDHMAELLQRGFGYALALAGDEHLARDLVQDACVRLLKRRRGFELPYFFRTIRNRFIDGLRRAEKIRFTGIAMPDADPSAGGMVAEPADPQSAERFAGPDDAALEKAMRELPVEHREILWLHAVEERTGLEISALTRRPRNTVLSLLNRAKHHMRLRLAELEGRTSATQQNDEFAGGLRPTPAIHQAGASREAPNRSDEDDADSSDTARIA